MRRSQVWMVLATIILSPAAWAGLPDVDTYYIGRDKLATFTSGTYSGLANPNFDRLTFLLGHGNHYHSKSSYIYTGPAGSPVVRPWPNGFFLPEPSQGPSFQLRPGSGVFAGKNRSGLGIGTEEQWDFRLRSVDYLSTFTPGNLENTLFNSSGGRWNGSLAGSDLWLNLHSISAGLKIADPLGNVILDTAGQSFNLGDAMSLDFTPVVFVDETAPYGDYFARFTLSDTQAVNPWQDSGQFEFRFSHVPEPASGSLLLVALSGVCIRRWRRS